MRVKINNGISVVVIVDGCFGYLSERKFSLFSLSCVVVVVDVNIRVVTKQKIIENNKIKKRLTPKISFLLFLLLLQYLGFCCCCCFLQMLEK